MPRGFWDAFSSSVGPSMESSAADYRRVQAQKDRDERADKLEQERRDYAANLSDYEFARRSGDVASMTEIAKLLGREVTPAQRISGWETQLGKLDPASLNARIVAGGLDPQAQEAARRVLPAAGIEMERLNRLTTADQQAQTQYEQAQTLFGQQQEQYRHELEQRPVDRAWTIRWRNIQEAAQTPGQAGLDKYREYDIISDEQYKKMSKDILDDALLNELNLELVRLRKTTTLLSQQASRVGMHNALLRGYEHLVLAEVRLKLAEEKAGDRWYRKATDAQKIALADVKKEIKDIKAMQEAARKGVGGESVGPLSGEAGGEVPDENIQNRLNEPAGAPTPLTIDPTPTGTAEAVLGGTTSAADETPLPTVPATTDTATTVLGGRPLEREEGAGRRRWGHDLPPSSIQWPVLRQIWEQHKEVSPTPSFDAWVESIPFAEGAEAVNKFLQSPFSAVGEYFRGPTVPPVNPNLPIGDSSVGSGIVEPLGLDTVTDLPEESPVEYASLAMRLMRPSMGGSFSGGNDFPEDSPISMTDLPVDAQPYVRRSREERPDVPVSVDGGDILEEPPVDYASLGLGPQPYVRGSREVRPGVAISMDGGDELPDDIQAAYADLRLNQIRPEVAFELRDFEPEPVGMSVEESDLPLERMTVTLLKKTEELVAEPVLNDGTSLVALEVLKKHSNPNGKYQIIIDLNTNTSTLMRGDEFVKQYPVATADTTGGRYGKKYYTPSGETQIYTKSTQRKSSTKEGPGYGPLWMGMYPEGDYKHKFASIGMHGPWESEADIVSDGRFILDGRLSHGCIRYKTDDLNDLAKWVGKDTRVFVIPYKGN